MARLERFVQEDHRGQSRDINQLEASFKIPRGKYNSEKQLNRLGRQRQEGRRENDEEPFYFKLSNSQSQSPSRRPQARPELANLQNMKRVLKDHYCSQISLKSEERRLSQRKKIMDEQDYLTHFQKHQNFQSKHQNRQNSDYNRLLREEISKKAILIDCIKSEQRQADRNRQPKQLNLIHKAQSFKKFYEQAYRFRQEVAKQYEMYMKQQKKYQVKRNKELLLNLSAKRSHTPHQNFENNLRSNQKETLRRVLEQQMQQKSESTRQIHHPHPQPQGYHPINNPIDFKMDVNNRYIIQQLLNKQRNL